jgi:hypothetical protein
MCYAQIGGLCAATFILEAEFEREAPGAERLRALGRRDDFEITLVNKENYFVFQPMPAEVGAPIVLVGQPNTAEQKLDNPIYVPKGKRSGTSAAGSTPRKGTGPICATPNSREPRANRASAT